MSDEYVISDGPAPERPKIVKNFCSYGDDDEVPTREDYAIATQDPDD